MEVFGALGVLVGSIVIIVITVLGFLMPWFIYKIHKNVKAIRELLEKKESFSFQHIERSENSKI
ncbi:hypothetical protein [Desulfothermus sp.]